MARGNRDASAHAAVGSRGTEYMRAAAPSLRSPLPSDEELRIDNFGKQGSLGLA
jgi:hypothetical protein